jgi:PQQ-dependent dehydrogenase (methanol/ethanol family)
MNKDQVNKTNDTEWYLIYTKIKVMKTKLTLQKSLLSALFFPIISGLTLANVNTATLSQPDGEWLNYGRDYKEQRFGPQQQINPDTIDRLGLQWSFTFPTERAMESTPLMHDGTLYVTTPWSRVFAMDARNGEPLWSFDPKVAKSHLINGCCGPINRGAALWTSEDKTLVFIGSFDGRLIAIDAENGQEVWSTQTTATDSHYTITGAPRVIDGKVIIGNGGAELGARGYITAYDASNGEMLWRFYTVPGDPSKPQESAALERALPSWNGEWWKYGGGGTVWDAMAYDPKLDLLYIGTGNGSPWNREIRSPGGGDNLYLSSIVALRPSTGEYVWHYQVTPQENWDYTATQHLILADLDINGQTRQVIMQAPKNGFFYVLDRRSGELLSADAYAQVNWASHIDMSTGRPVEKAVANYQQTGGSLIWPSPFGAHNWQPMAYSPQTKLVYIPEQHIASYYSADKEFSYKNHRFNTGVDFWGMRNHGDPIIARATKDAIVRGYLSAWDPVEKRKLWQVRHPMAVNGGILATAGGLVFQGTGTGGFHAYDAANGEHLWGFQTDSSILAGPISYSLDGEQYIAVTQGAGGGAMLVMGNNITQKIVVKENALAKNPNRLLVFKLQSSPPADSNNQTKQQVMRSPPTIKQHNLSASQLLTGAKLYERNCSSCHGLGANASNVVPDLRYMTAQTHSDFQAIVLAGLRTHKGMVGFYETLSPEQVDYIHGYIRNQNFQLHQEQSMTGWWHQLRYWFWYWLTRMGDALPWLANSSRDMVMGS